MSPANMLAVAVVLLAAASCLTLTDAACSGGQSRQITLVIEYITIPTTVAGMYKRAIAVNGTIPGPRIDVNECDTMSVTVINMMNDSTTSIHWHGMTMYDAPYEDGVVGVTQCGIAPGVSFSYAFTAFPAGTYWYHGHMQQQYVEGLYGTLVVHAVDEATSLLAPSLYSAEWTWMIADFYNYDARTILLPWFLSPASQGQEPQPDTAVVNGTMANTTHFYVGASDTIMIRLINAAALSMYTVSIDGAPLTIIEVDGTPVSPMVVDALTLNVAQRTVVTININDIIANNGNVNAVWARVTLMADSSLSDDPYAPSFEPNWVDQRYWTGVIHIGQPSSTAFPTYSNTLNLPANTPSQVEMNLLDARVTNTRALYTPLTTSTTVPSPTHYLWLEVSFMNNAANVNLAYFNNITFDMSDTEMTGMIPVLYEANYANLKSTSTSPIITGNNLGYYYIPNNAVVELILINTDTGDHPFHFHGHHFYVVATSDYPQAEYLYENQWLIRDTVDAPAGGWVKIRFIANNPGVWMFHCHIDWHMSAGLVALMIEGGDALYPPNVAIPANHLSLCDNTVVQEVNALQSTYLASVGDQNTGSSGGGGLSSGAKVGLGVGLGIGGCLLITLVVIVYLARNRQSKTQPVAKKAAYINQDGDEQELSRTNLKDATSPAAIPSPQESDMALAS